MNRSKSRCSTSSEEPNEDSILEAEHARLQRSYRVMQNDYKKYREETKRIINKQNTLVDSLQAEKDEIDTCLNKMKTTQNKNKDKHNAQTLAELSKTEKDYQMLIKEERETIQQLDRQIAKMENKIAIQRKQMGGVHNCTAKQIVIQKKKTVLENRLDKAMVHFNRQLAINSSLREDIDHLRQEKAIFDSLYKKLARELDQSKREMADIIETSTHAYEQRDEAQNKMQALKERSEKDQGQHDMEMKDLLRMIAHDNKIKQFMGIKASDRADFKAEEQAKKAKKGGDGDQQIKADNETIRMFEDAFRRIQEVTKETDIGKMVAQFIKKEDENFALFNYVNELNAEVETLNEQVVKIQKQMKAVELEDEYMEEDRQTAMRKIEGEHEKVMTEKEAVEKRLTEINKVMDQLKSGVEGMFKLIGCDPKPILEMLGAESGITEKNIMLYLGLIELRANELLSFKNYNQFKQEKTEEATVVPVSTKLKTAALHVVPPSVGDDGGEDEEGDDGLIPLPESEIRRRALKASAPRAHSVTQPTNNTKVSTPAKDSKKKKIQ